MSRGRVDSYFFRLLPEFVRTENQIFNARTAWALLAHKRDYDEEYKHAA